MKKKITLLFLTVFFSVFAQKKQTFNFIDTDLEVVLNKVESVFNIKFSYSSEIVENKKLTFVQEATLETVLAAIENQTQIYSQQINNRYYILKLNNKTTICGYIKDKNSLEPIENVSIINQQTKLGTSTDKDGFFHIDMIKSETIEITYLGYQKLNFLTSDFDANECKTIFLTEDTFNIDEVLINEYLTSGITKNKDGSITLTPSNLGILPGLTEPDVLQNILLLPGIKSPNETASELYIRGGTPDQNLILFDDIKMFYSGHFFGMISAFNPYIVEEINFYKGGSKAKYGNRISGVIDIATKEITEDKIKGGFGFNLTHSDAYLQTKVSNKFDVLISARRSITDAIKTETFNKFSKKVFQNTKISDGNRVFEEDKVQNIKDLFFFNDYYLKFNYKPTQNDKLTFSNIAVKNKLEYEFIIEEFDEKSNDKLNIDNNGFKLEWTHNYNNSISHNFNTYFSNFDLNYTGLNLSADEVQNKTIKKNSVKDFTATFQTNIKLSNNNKLNIGYQFSNNKVAYTLGYENVFLEQENFNDAVSETNDINTLFAEYEYYKNNWFLYIGSRFNHNSIIKEFNIEPRIELQRKINSKLKINVSAEQNYQTLSKILELNTSNFGLENQIWVLSNKEDKSILKSHQFTTRINYKNKGWNIDFEAYNKKIHGITSLTNGFINTTNSYSEGKSEIVGLDLLLKKKFNNYRTYMSYSLTKNKSTFNAINNGKAFNGNQDIRNSFTWSHSYKIQDFEFSLGWNIRSGIPYTIADGLITNEDNETVINYDEVNAKRLPNYHRLDFSTYYKFNFTDNSKWKGKFGFSLLNIYNRKNILNRNYKIRFDDNGQEVLQMLDRYSLGITPNFVFRVEF